MISLAALPDLTALAAAHTHHCHEGDWWKLAAERHDASKVGIRRSLIEHHRLSIAPLGDIDFTLVEMSDAPEGEVISSVELFGLDEMIIFAFYWANRSRYQTVVDLGANLGLHSIVLARMGFSVKAYEPDPVHLRHLKTHLEMNRLSTSVMVHEAAVTVNSGNVEFLRVLGNTTGSHVLGAKNAPYGAIEQFNVKAVSIGGAIEGADLVKMDVEGSEAELLTALRAGELQSTDIICEVGSEENAEAIWNHFANSPVKMYSQKLGWSAARSYHDLPAHHSEGSLFLSTKGHMPWDTQT